MNKPLEIPSVLHKLPPGSKAWTGNGVFDASAATVGPDPGDPSMARLAAVSRRNHRVLSCGIRLPLEDLDKLCLAWLRARGVFDNVSVVVSKSLWDARNACTSGLRELGEVE